MRQIAEGVQEPPRPRAMWRDAMLTTGTSVSSTALSAVASVIIARQLGVSGRGISATIQSIAIVCGTVGTLGLPAAASFAIARVGLENRPRIAGAAIVSGAALGSLAGVIAVIIVAITRPTGAGLLAIIAGGGIAFSLVWQDLFAQLTLTTADVRWYAVTQVAGPAVILAAVVVIAVTGHLRVTAVLALGCAGSLVGGAVGAVALARNGLFVIRRQLLMPAVVVNTLRPYFRYAAMLFVVTTLAQVVQRIDIVLVELFKGPRPAGLYTIASQLGALMLVIPAAIGAVVFRRGARSDRGHWEDALQALTWTAVVGIASGVVLAFVAHLIIGHLFGHRYLGATTAFRCLIPGVVLLGTQSVLSNYIASRGQLRAVVGAWLTAAVLGIGLDLVAIPLYGIVGAAVVSSVSYLAVLGLHLRALRSLRQASQVAMRE